MNWRALRHRCTAGPHPLDAPPEAGGLESARGRDRSYWHPGEIWAGAKFPWAVLVMASAKVHLPIHSLHPVDCGPPLLSNGGKHLMCNALQTSTGGRSIAGCRPVRGLDFRSKCVSTLIACCFVLWLPDSAYAQVSSNSCGPVWNQNHFGPYDYLNPQGHLGVVERAHFTPEVEHSLRGKTTVAGGDINYTLKAFPNHHRALVSASRLAEKYKKDQPPGMEWPIECYYERALRFSPFDFVARGLYAQWLTKRQRGDDARIQLQVMLDLAKEDPLSHYNLGLLYFDLGDHEAALIQAHQAEKLGFLNPALTESLKSIGKWREPAVIATPAVGTPSGTTGTNRP